MESITRMDDTFNLADDVRLAKNGDKNAFEKLMLKNNDSMYRIAAGILSNHQDIEDAYQNTILKCYKGLPALRKNEFFKTWLIRILINECRSILKSGRKLVPMEEIQSDTVSADTSMNLELTSAVNSLEEDLKIVTLLFYFEDLSQKEISKILVIPEGTVGSRLSRARTKLHEILKDS